jgi:ABC-type sugar transport system ATPase subunit
MIGRNVVNDLPPMDRNIAMVFQNYALYPHKSVYQNMAFGLQMRKYPADEIESAVREAADILGIGRCSSASRASSPAGSASASRSAAPSCATRKCSCSTSRSPTWTRSCACRCAWS